MNDVTWMIPKMQNLWAPMEEDRMDNVYKKLAEKLDQIPNGFPVTDTGVELKLLQKIFSPKDAEVALQLNPDMSPGNTEVSPS